MRFEIVLASAALIAAAAAAPTPEAHALFRRQFPVLQCSHLTGGMHVIAGAGANSPDEKSYGYLGSLATSILNAVPGSTNVSLPYDKVFATLTPQPKLSPSAIPNGMTTLKTYIENYHYACPNTKIALIGYSSGAIIIMNDLCLGGNGQGTNQINPLLAPNTIIGTVVYGDETRTAGTPYDLGTCGSSYSGLAPRDAALCYPFANSMQSYCDLEDPDCCVGSGNDVSVHFSYPAKYDAAATEFIVNAFHAAGGP